MDTRPLWKITYGLYIVTSKRGERFNSQIANTVFQISSETPTIAVSINKKNLTNIFIRESKVFAVAVLAQEAPLALVGQFGFKSGREVDKFAGINYRLTPGGLPCVTDHTLACLEARVIQEVDAGTHTIFIGELTDAANLREGTPMTYAYYQQVKRGSVPPSAPAFTAKPKEENKAAMDKYICTICGYVYDPLLGDPENNIPADTPFDKLPDDWVCPVCGAGKKEFKKEG